MTFKNTDLFPVLKHATNPETWRAMFLGNENKCLSNVPIFKEIISLRDEAARLLGYNNYAELRVEDKIAKTPQNVTDFLNSLHEGLLPRAKSEIAQLLALKKEDLESRSLNEAFDGRYYLWDHRFYDRMMLEKNHDIDQNKIAEYFPLEKAIRGMLTIFEKLFGLIFVELQGSERDQFVWHKDVSLFSVWDDEGEGGGFVGYLYLDLFPREGKYGHAADFNLQPVCYAW